MDAVEFVKTVNMLCKNLRCKECPVYKEGICTVGFDDYSVESIEETVSKVEQWTKDHPVKTRQSEFLKMFPNAELVADVIWIKPCHVDTKLMTEKHVCYSMSCETCRRKYWLAEVTDND